MEGIHQFRTGRLILIYFSRVAAALFHRILRAYSNKEKFKVYLFIPLYPGNEGDIADTRASGLVRELLHYEYLTISRGEGSLFQCLQREGINPSDYLIICGLRNHSKLGSTPVTEMIYIHSKIIIVDDRYALIGSANLNDRSLAGSRDSEIAVFINNILMYRFL